MFAINIPRTEKIDHNGTEHCLKHDKKT